MTTDGRLLTAGDVSQVASLSRLELDDEEIERQGHHLNQLLEQFAKLQELDVTGVEPTSHAFTVVNVFRGDEALPSLPREEVLSNAPESRDGCFVVPRILDT
jgi:aspartyl-tRNA(Asn)/glutamyl-tRNA(Gln) amidotransferase subunit C